MPISGQVVDAQGSLVPITSARATQQGIELPCHTSGADRGDAGMAADLPAENPFHFYCTPIGPGIAELELTAQGQTLRREVEVTKKKQREPACGTLLVNSGAVFELEGPGCPNGSATAVQGSFLDARGEPTDGTLTIYLNSEGSSEVPCQIAGGQFQCPALTPYSAHYTLNAKVGLSTLEIPVRVSAAECVVSTVTTNIDLSMQTCGEQAPALRLPARALCPEDAEAPHARAKALDGEWVDCAIEPSSGTTPGENCWYMVTCPALTPTGGGVYTLELTQADRRIEIEREVADDGCNPTTSIEEVVGLAD